jgi:hypothetical protein
MQHMEQQRLLDALSKCDIPLHTYCHLSHVLSVLMSVTQDRARGSCRVQEKGSVGREGERRGTVALLLQAIQV